jgi:shikimate kinase
VYTNFTTWARVGKNSKKNILQMGNLVFICGMPGSGKSSLAKRLASRLSWKYTDLDNVITDVSGNSPQDWIEKQGEEAFRVFERDTLRNLDKNLNQIIACGGGTPCFFDNLAYMQSQGLCIYLRMTPAAIVSRLMQNKGWEKRPLLGNNPEVVKHRIAELWNIRRPFYEKINFQVDGLQPDLEQILLEVERYFKLKS